MRLFQVLCLVHVALNLLPCVFGLKCYDCIGAQERDSDKCLTSNPNAKTLVEVSGKSVMCLNVFIRMNYKGRRTIIFRTSRNVTADVNGQCSEGFQEYNVYPNVTSIVGCYCNTDACNNAVFAKAPIQTQGPMKLIIYSIALLISAHVCNS